MNIKDTAKEVIYAVIPITIIILLFKVTIIDFPSEIIINFIAGSVLVILGLFFFLLGINLGLLQVGEYIGSVLAKKGKLSLILGLGFLIGFVVTVAEPDVQVLASQVASVSGGEIPKNVLVTFVALGVGIFIAISLFRIVFNVPLVYILMIGYTLVFVLALFTQPSFVPVSFDAGGVTTGPMTVPFILSLGVGITSVTRSKKGSNDSFGLVALASIGPILSVLILGVIYK